MGSRTNRAIETAIDNKLHKSFIFKSPKHRLLKLTDYCAVKKYDAINHASLISDLMGVNALNVRKDDYDNELCNFLNYKVAKSPNSFNILRMFKPGELLNSVMSY